jgi:hypothetical protein
MGISHGESTCILPRFGFGINKGMAYMAVHKGDADTGNILTPEHVPTIELLNG